MAGPWPALLAWDRRRSKFGAATNAPAALLASSGEHSFQLAALVKLAHDIAATHETPRNIKLWNGGPIRKLLDSFAELLVGEHVHVFEVGAQLFEDLHYSRRKAALGEQLVAFHEQHDALAIDHALDSVSQVWVHASSPGRWLLSTLGVATIAGGASLQGERVDRPMHGRAERAIHHLMLGD